LCTHIFGLQNLVFQHKDVEATRVCTTHYKLFMPKLFFKSFLFIRKEVYVNLILFR
jgi:hypothetical protein